MEEEESPDESNAPPQSQQARDSPRNLRPSQAGQKRDSPRDTRPRQGQNRAYEQKKKPCKSRIDELAVPAKRLMLNLWQDHAHHFEAERKRNVLRAVQELYSMTPEQAEIYFQRKRKELKQLLRQKKTKKKQAEACRKKAEKEDRDRAYLVFFQFLILGFWFARSHEIPPLVSSRLRKLSDVILRQICQLRNIDVPERPAKDEASKHLVMLADWIAVRMEQIYFEAQMVANKELDEIEEEVVKIMDLEGEQKEKPAEKTSILNKEVKVDEPKMEEEDISEMDNYPPE